jgi:hypothetical protein
MLGVSAGRPKPLSVWAFEAVCESGRTLKFLAQRSVAFAACLRSKLQPVDRNRAGEHEKECLVSLSASPSRRQKERLCRY